jgi:hypothetical protein
MMTNNVGALRHLLLATGMFVAWTSCTLDVARAELLARYTFDDGTAADSTASGLHGTLVGNAMIVPDAAPGRGMVLQLDGVATGGPTGGSHVQIQDPTGVLNFGATGPHQGSATVAAWVFNNDWTNHSTILNQGEWRNGIGFSVKADSPAANCTECSLWVGAEPFNVDGMSISVPANEAHRSDGLVPQGSWNHVATTWAYDGTQTAITFYVNGLPSGFLEGGMMNGRVTPPIDNTGDGVGDTRIGAEWRDANAANFRWVFNGLIDDLQIYDTALDQAGIEQAMSGNIGPPLLLGDTDANGVVDFADFEPIRANFRKPVAARTDGDLVRNGVVDFADFHQWKAAFLGMGGSLAGVDLGFLGTVPEPSTAVIMLLAGTGLVCYQARSRS